MDVERFCREFSRLHGPVIRNWGRIEITGDRKEDACVLLSRAELECMERALEIFCESPAGKDICKELELIASQSTIRAGSVGSAIEMAFDQPVGEDGNRPSL